MTTNICFGGPDLTHRLHHRVGDGAPRLDDVAPPRAAPWHTAPEQCGGPASAREASRRPPVAWRAVPQRFYVETLGCPKNQVDSRQADRHAARRRAWCRPTTPARADLVVVNTCAFIEEARQESIDTILALDEQRRRRRPAGRHRLHGRALRRRAGRRPARGRPGRRLRRAGRRSAAKPASAGAAPCPPFDLLNLPRPASARAVGLREGRRGLRPQRAGSAPSRRSGARSAAATSTSILAEVDAARGRARSCSSPRTSPASAGPTRARAPAPSSRWCGAVAERVDRVRLLYLYPSDLTDALIDAICATGVPYFDLSLQHVSRRCCGACAGGATATGSSPHRRHPRAASPTPRSGRNFIVGYPGETEADHDQLLALRRGGPARLVRLLRLLAGGRHLRRRPRRRGRPPR